MRVWVAGVWVLAWLVALVVWPKVDYAKHLGRVDRLFREVSDVAYWTEMDADLRKVGFAKYIKVVTPAANSQPIFTQDNALHFLHGYEGCRRILEISCCNGWPYLRVLTGSLGKPQRPALRRKNPTVLHTPAISAWCSPLVDESKLNIKPYSYIDIFRRPNWNKDKMTKLYIRSDLTLTHLSTDGAIGVGSGQSFPNVVDTYARRHNGSHARQEHPPSPTAHAFLSGQIIFGALIFAGGFYGFLYAFNKSGALHSDTGALYVFFGIAGALVGATICILALP